MTETQMLETIRNAPATVAYFSTPACNVCKVLRPKVEQLVESHPGVGFLYVDTTVHPAMGGQHLVFAAPTIILFGRGKELGRFSRNVSLADLDRYLEILTREAEE